MHKMLIAVFDNESAAFQGLSALKDLHKNGDITVYASAVIAKDKSGKIEVKQQADRGPVGTALGLLTGSLIGGPAGVAVGASAGGVGGLLFDLDSSGVGANFVDDASKNLTAGKTAILADVDESWTTPVDVRLREHGGIVSRRLRAEVVEDQLARESAALEANLKAHEDELKRASAEHKAAIKKDIDDLKKHLKATQDQAKAKLDQTKAEMEAKIKALQDQAKGASDRMKARIEKRSADVKADFEVRSKKLNQAWKLTKEALAS